MTHSKLWGASSLGLALTIVVGILPRAAGAQIFGSDPESLKRTDSLINKAEDLVKEAVSARGELAKTLDAYNAIFKSDVENVRKAYRSVESGMEKTEKQRATVKRKLDEMNVGAEAYFASWSESLPGISSPDLRKRSEARMAETRRQFDGVLAAVSKAREEYEPFMTNLKDQWTYLGHDLNASGIQSLEPDRVKLNEKADELFEVIDSGMRDAGEYIESLRSSRPVS